MPLRDRLVLCKILNRILPAKDPEIKLIGRGYYHGFRCGRDYRRAEFPLPVVAQQDVSQLKPDRAVKLKILSKFHKL